MARILLIEDNRDNRELMRYLLTAFGHVLLTAENGETGITMALREHPDLVLCDIHLPGADGYAVLRELRGHSALDAIPIVAVTALAMLGDRDKGLAAGFAGYIAKPIEPQSFVATVDAYLEPELRGSRPQVASDGGATEVTPVPPSRATVLVVDDSETNRELIFQTLAPFGYRVYTVASVADALVQAATLRPDLVLSDLHMPGDDGFELVRNLKEHPQLARMPVMLISSSIWGERDRQIALQLGAARFLLRPIEPQRLLDEVAGCLAEYGVA